MKYLLLPLLVVALLWIISIAWFNRRKSPGNNRDSGGGDTGGGFSSSGCDGHDGGCDGGDGGGGD